MAASNLKEKTAKGIFWGGLSNVTQQLIGMFIGIQMARIVGVEDYGLVGMLAVFSGIATTIINSGFTTALVNKPELTHKDCNAVFWFTVIAGILCYAILFFAAPLIAIFFNQPRLTALSRVLFLCFLISGISSVSYTILFKQLRIKTLALTDITAMLLSGAVGIAMAFHGFGYWALAFQSLVYVSTGAIMRFILAPWKPTFMFDLSPLKSFFSFSVKLFLTNIIGQISSNLFSIVLGKFYDEKKVGFYSQGSKWMFMGHSLIAGMLNSVAQPVLVSTNETPERQRQVFYKLMRFGAFVSFPLMLGLAFVGKEFILLAIGEKWLDSVIYLQLFCIWGAIGYANILYSMLLVTHGKSDIYMTVTLLVSALQFAAACLLYPWGITVMVVGYILSYIAGVFVWHGYAHKYVGIRLWTVIKEMLPYIGATLASFAAASIATRPFENIALIFTLKIAVSAIVYLGILWISGSKLLKEAITFGLYRKIE